jgi:hypothetical protein
VTEKAALTTLPTFVKAVDPEPPESNRSKASSDGEQTLGSFPAAGKVENQTTSVDTVPAVTGKPCAPDDETPFIRREPHASNDDDVEYEEALTLLVKSAPSRGSAPARRIPAVDPAAARRKRGSRSSARGISAGGRKA